MIAVVAWGGCGRPRDRHFGAGRMALGRLRLGGRGQLGRTRRRQGEALGLADFGQIARRRLRQAGGRRNRRRWTGSRRERFEGRQGYGRRESRAGRLRGSPPARAGPIAPPDRRLQLSQHARVDDDVVEGLRDALGRRRRGPERRSGAPEPRQCSSQTLSAPARTTAAAPGRTLRRTRRGLSPPSNERSSNVASSSLHPPPYAKRLTIESN